MIPILVLQQCLVIISITKTGVVPQAASEVTTALF